VCDGAKETVSSVVLKLMMTTPLAVPVAVAVFGVAGDVV